MGVMECVSKGVRFLRGNTVVGVAHIHAGGGCEGPDVAGACGAAAVEQSRDGDGEWKPVE